MPLYAVVLFIIACCLDVLGITLLLLETFDPSFS